MQKSKLKEEFKGRVYGFALDVIKLVEQLPEGNKQGNTTYRITNLLD